MKHYVGERTAEGCQVDVIDKEAPRRRFLPLRFNLRNRSLIGLEWGIYPHVGVAA